MAPKLSIFLIKILDPTMLNNLPNEVFIDILLYLNREDIEKIQSTSQKFHKIINSHADYLPLRRFYALLIYPEKEEIIGKIYKTQSSWKDHKCDEIIGLDETHKLISFKLLKFKRIKINKTGFFNSTKEWDQTIINGTDLVGKTLDFFKKVKEHTGKKVKSFSCEGAEENLQTWIELFSKFIPGNIIN